VFQVPRVVLKKEKEKHDFSDELEAHNLSLLGYP
jgi:hypothetical protein